MISAHEWYESTLPNLKLIKAIQLDAYKAGMTRAASEVAGHWNDRGVMVNQCEQSQRSASVILKIRDNLKEIPNE